MEKITFQDTTVLKKPYIDFNGIEYELQDGTYDGGTDLNASTFNTMQNNIEEAIDGTNWTSLTYQNTYSSFDETDFNPLQYKKIGNQVFLRGMIKSTSANPDIYTAICATLPENYTPQKTNYFIANNSDRAISITVSNDGKIRIFNTLIGWISLNGISFFTD